MFSRKCPIRILKVRASLLELLFGHAYLRLGTTVAIYEIVCAFGALSCAFIGDILGRRRMLFLAGCVVIVGVFLQATPFSLAQLIVARIITGMFVNYMGSHTR